MTAPKGFTDRLDELERKERDYDALAARLAALELSAWDVHEAISDALDSPEDANERTIRRVLDEMGELLPAHRPADSATRQESDAHG